MRLTNGGAMALPVKPKFGPVAPIVLDDTAAGTGAQAPAVFAAPAYDPIADRLVAIWSCCQDALYGGVASTHYASWSVPGITNWTPLLGSVRIPTIIGSRSAHSLERLVDGR